MKRAECLGRSQQDDVLYHGRLQAKAQTHAGL